MPYAYFVQWKYWEIILNMAAPTTFQMHGKSTSAPLSKKLCAYTVYNMV